MTARQKREPTAHTVAQIEARFELASYWFGGTWCPAVHRIGDGYGIRIVRSESLTLNNRSVTYDYFYLDADGTITTAPRGYAREYKPGRVTDIVEAFERFATPSPTARRIA